MKEPVYLSIDKDVLNPDSAIPDWDQGYICLDALKRLHASIFKNEKVIGMDICGEYSEAHDLIDAQEGGLLNENTNVEILEEVKLEGWSLNRLSRHCRLCSPA